MMNVAIINPYPNQYSQTFINAHIERIQGNKFFLKDGYLPTTSGENNRLYHPSLPLKLFYKALNHFGWAEERTFHARKIAKYLTKNKIDVVLAEFGQTGAAVYEICEKVDIPLVVHFHGADAHRDRYLLPLKSEYQSMFRTAKYVIVVSQHMYDHMLSLGANKEQLVLNTYGPHDDFFGITPSFSTTNITTVGRFVPKKAPYLTILAFQKVLEKFPEAKLNMVGEGELLPMCRNMVFSLGIDSSVTFLGIKGHDEIKNIFSGSYCYIQHSIISHDHDTEGTPVSIIEASAAGLPVVSTLHAGIPDVIEHKETGLLVKERDIDAMANCIATLLGDRGLAESMGSRGKERIKANFSMSKHIDTLNQVLQKATYAK